MLSDGMQQRASLCRCLIHNPELLMVGKRCSGPTFRNDAGSVSLRSDFDRWLRMDTEHSSITEPVRRIEVFTGTGRRRTWSAEDKARIVAESLTSGESVCAVARRHGLSPQQQFGWRRQARQPAASADTAAPLFVPAVVEAPMAERAVRRRGRKKITDSPSSCRLIRSA